jgi:hypothetical protein
VTCNRSNLAVLSFLTLLAVIKSPANAQTPIYKYVDEDGQTVFTDQPPSSKSKTELIEIESPNTATPTAIDKSNGGTPKAEKKSTVHYETVISSPKDGDTIPVGPGNFTVTALLSPPLSPQETVRLMIDEVAVGPAQKQSTWQLTNVFRGEHKLVAERLLGKEQVLHRSATNTIFVLRPSIR